MKKCIAAALAAALLLTGCSWEEPDYVPDADLQQQGGATQPTEQEEVHDGSFTLAYWPERSLNPFHCTDLTNRVLFSLVYQGLFTVNSAYEARPVLCGSYNVSADMKTWTFHLAKASFSDGTAVTAEDVRASLENARGSAWYGNRLQHVTTITAVADSVALQLDTPCDNLPLLLDIPIVKASEVNAASPLGTGPYRFDGAQLRRQAGWWCDAQLPVTAQTIPLLEAESLSQIRDLFERENVGIVCSDPGQEHVDFRRDYELWSCESGQFLYLMCSEKSEVFENDTIRAALTHAIDRNTIVSQYYGGFAYAATLPASPKSPFYDQKLAAQFGLDAQKLTDAVAAAQLKSNEIILMVSTADATRKDVAQAIAEMLTGCGLSVTIKTVYPDELIDQLRWGKYDLFLGQTKLSANMDLSPFFANNGSLSYGGLSDGAVYALCLNALENVGNYYSLHKLVMENAWLCPILFRSNAIYGARGTTTGLQPARDAIYYYDLGLSLDDIKVSG